METVFEKKKFKWRPRCLSYGTTAVYTDNKGQSWYKPEIINNIHDKTTGLEVAQYIISQHLKFVTRIPQYALPTNYLYHCRNLTAFRWHWHQLMRHTKLQNEASGKQNPLVPFSYQKASRVHQDPHASCSAWFAFQFHQHCPFSSLQQTRYNQFVHPEK